MRRRRLLILGSALLMLGPTMAAGQGNDPECDFGLIGGDWARIQARLAERPGIEGTSENVLERGCFVGMVRSAKAEPDVGAFAGKTFVRVDRQGPQGTWRSVQFPLDGSSTLDAERLIEMPYAIADSTTAWASGPSPSPPLITCTREHCTGAG